MLPLPRTSTAALRTCLPRSPSTLSISLRAYSNPSIRFNSADRLSGRTCMITGGTSGIGFAIAERFLQEGAERVILTGRSQKRLVDAAVRLGAPQGKDDNAGDQVATRAPEEDQQQQQARLDIEEMKCGRVNWFVGDVSERGSWLRELEREMTPVDILVNAAGISPSNLLPKTDPEDISRTIRTNLQGAILTSRAFMRAVVRNRMKTRRISPSSSGEGANPSKCIINISSLLAHKGGTGSVPYSASKAGVLGLTRSLAVEAAHSLSGGVVVRSNAIVPGYIDTPMIANFSKPDVASILENIPVGRFGNPHEVADAAVFLAQNEYANNCTLNIDGGLSAV